MNQSVQFPTLLACMRKEAFQTKIISLLMRVWSLYVQHAITKRKKKTILILAKAIKYKFLRSLKMDGGSVSLRVP